MATSIRPILFRYTLLICASCIVLLCIQDSLYEILTALTKQESNDPSIVPLGPDGDHGNGIKRELVFLQMIFRHGHRAPFMTYPTDATNESFWTEGMGMLTKLGRLQHYALGLHLQNRYKGFITTNPNEVDMIMAEAFRCQFGAYCFLAGLYQPTEEHRISDGLLWQPVISRHSEALGREAKGVLSRKSCPAAMKESSRLKASKMGIDTLKKYKRLYNFWSRGALRLINSWSLAADLGKTMTVERDYNLSVPDWGLKYWDEFNIQSGITYFFNFGTAFIQRLRIGALLDYMLKRSETAALEKTPKKKVLIYSSHGSYVACMLLALGQYNFLAPPHASTVVFELWRDQHHGHTVRWLYFNSSNPERRVDHPFVLRPRGCLDDFCPLHVLRENTRHLIPHNLGRECKEDASNRTIIPSEIIPGLYSTAKIPEIPFLLMLLTVLCAIKLHP